MIGIWLSLSGRKGEGVFALVDREDYDIASSISWYLHAPKLSKTTYAKHVGKAAGTLYLHRVVMNAGEGDEIDHIDGDGLNNTKANLRSVTHSQNLKFGHIRRTFDEWESRL